MVTTKTVTQQVRRGEIIEVVIPEKTILIDASVVKGRVRISVTYTGEVKVSRPKRIDISATNLDQPAPLADIDD